MTTTFTDDLIKQSFAARDAAVAAHQTPVGYEYCRYIQAEVLPEWSSKKIDTVYTQKHGRNTVKDGLRITLEPNGNKEMVAMSHHLRVDLSGLHDLVSVVLVRRDGLWTVESAKTAKPGEYVPEEENLAAVAWKIDLSLINDVISSAVAALATGNPAAIEKAEVAREQLRRRGVSVPGMQRQFMRACSTTRGF